MLGQHKDAAFDEALGAYIATEHYQKENTEIISKITNYRNTLTSTAQVNEFNKILDLIYASDTRMTEAMYEAGYADCSQRK